MTRSPGSPRAAAVAGAAAFVAMFVFVDPAHAQGEAAPLGSLTVDRAVATEALVDTDGDGRLELVLVTAAGEFARHGLVGTPAAPLALQHLGSLSLRDPQHTLFSFADVAAAPGTELVVADRSGTAWLPWTAGAEPRRLAARARCTLRVDRPLHSPFVRDLDGDGRLDLLLPSLQGCQPFVQERTAGGADDGAPRFRMLPPVAVPVQVTAGDDAQNLDDERQGGLTIPPIETADLDGDGRPDLLSQEGMRRAFHLQAEDGTFRPPLELDLEQFVDSTPKAALAPGATAVLGDRQHLQRGDVDGDGIPDFVIAHRRKVWTFLGGRGGPQFTKARTQAVADDVSAMLLLDLDEDRKADLLTFQVQVPSVGALVLGLVAGIDVDVRVVGYRSEAGGFAGTPAWRRTLTLRVPALLSLLSRQDELVQRFLTIVDTVRQNVRGSFTAAGVHEIALVAADGKLLEVFASRPDAGRGLAGAGARREMRRLVFEDPNPVFDLDRVFALLQGFVDERADALTGAGAAIARTPLRDPTTWRLVRLLAGPCDATAGDEVVAVYEDVAAPERRAFDVLGFVSASAR